MKRRDFLKGLLAGAAAVTLPPRALPFVEEWVAAAPEETVTAATLDELLKRLYAEPLFEQFGRMQRADNQLAASVVDRLWEREFQGDDIYFSVRSSEES